MLKTKVPNKYGLLSLVSGALGVLAIIGALGLGLSFLIMSPFFSSIGGNVERNIVVGLVGSAVLAVLCPLAAVIFALKQRLIAKTRYSAAGMTLGLIALVVEVVGLVIFFAVR